MRMKIAILEDNSERIQAMAEWLADRFPMYEAVWFADARTMTTWLKTHLSEVVACSLDHDLDLLPGDEGKWIDPGTGRDVADYLAEQTPAFPIVIHSTNVPAVAGMTLTLRERGWHVDTVTPYDDLAWVAASWGPLFRNAIVHNALFFVDPART